jgi:hypothetical protein
MHQHAWNSVLDRDEYGNHVAPRFHRLLFFELNGRPTVDAARRLENILLELERRYPWGPDGLLFVTAWGPRYFERGLRVRSPVEHPRALASFELPALDAYDLCLHLACDHEQRLAAVESALTQGQPIRGMASLDLRPILSWHETRTGFVGSGLPAQHQGVAGIPAGKPVAQSSPLYMGFKSGLTRNQASEDAVTIGRGPFRDGTTMHVSRMRLRLASWYAFLDERDRVARMYAPQVTPARAARFTTDAASAPQKLGEAARRFGVVGHAQASAQARRNGRPRILRRDFDTVDGDEAGLHFVSLQRTIDDFVATRKAMNASRAPSLNPGITDTVNNGINEFIFVTHRANYLVPPRSMRSFPLVS